MRCPFCLNSSVRQVGADSFECVRYLAWVDTRGDSQGRTYSVPIHLGCESRFTRADVERAAERARQAAAAKEARDRERRATLACLENSSDVDEVLAAVARAEEMSADPHVPLLPAAVGAWRRLASAGSVGPPLYEIVCVVGQKPTFGQMQFVERSRRAVWGVNAGQTLWLLDAEGGAWRTSDDATEGETYERGWRFGKQEGHMTFVVTAGAACEVSSRVERYRSTHGSPGQGRRWTARHGRVVNHDWPSLPLLGRLVSELQRHAPQPPSGGGCPYCGAPETATRIVLPDVAQCGRCHLRFALKAPWTER